MTTLDLYLDIGAKVFVMGPTNAARFSLPAMFQGSTLNLRIKLLLPNPSGGLLAPYSDVTEDAATPIRIGIGEPAGTEDPLAANEDLAYDEESGFIEGILDLNTAAVDAFLGDNLEETCYLEFDVGMPPDKLIQQSVNLRATLLDPEGAAAVLPMTNIRKNYEGRWFVKDEDIADPANWREVKMYTGAWVFGEPMTFPLQP
jgi:hypothetical protein